MDRILYKIYLFLFLLVIGSSIEAQIDSMKIDYASTNIKDSSSVKDTAKVKKKFVPFYLNHNFYEDLLRFNNLNLTKKTINKLDYRYAGDVLNYLPHSSLNNFGYLGAPNVPILFSLDGNNISLLNDNFYENNRLNNFADLNKVQVESIYNLYLVPIHRGFLYGIRNNNAAIIIQHNDSLKAKPITRIRYYQSNFNEAFINVFFSARVLSNLALTFRVTNAAKNDSYKNTSFGAWKVFVKGTYKFADSLLLSIKYNHLNLNSSINGGVNLTELSKNALENIDIYSTKAPVTFYYFNTNTESNRFSSNIGGKILPFGKTNITLTYNLEDINYYNNPERYTYRTITVADSLIFEKVNSYKSFHGNFTHTFSKNYFSSKVIAEYETIKLNFNNTSFSRKLNNFYTSIIVDYKLFNNFLHPSIFGKFSNYNKRTNLGYGFDVTVNPHQNLNFIFGYSNFRKSSDIFAASMLSTETKEKNSSLFASLGYRRKKVNASISYFQIKRKDYPFPIFNNGNLSLTESHIIYNKLDNIKNEGFNFYFNSEIFNILLYSNFNYQKSNSDLVTKKDNFNLTAGIYYVDTLFNSNLNLKAGINFYLFDASENFYYDYFNMIRSKYFYQNGVINSFSSNTAQNDKYKFDFVVAGTIRKAATFYFVFENFLDNKLFMIPYYPLPGRRIKLGIAWDFLD